MAESGDASSLEDFLSKVDKVQAAVHGLKTDQGDALEKADQLFEELQTDGSRTTASRTVINKQSAGRSGDDNDAPVPATMDAATFMKGMEQDAQERAQRRKQREAEAAIIKEKGNAAFKAGKLEEAHTLYSDALALHPSNTALLTNRALVALQLQRFSDAEQDCDLALRVDEHALKAWLRKGMACRALGKLEESMECLVHGCKLAKQADRPAFEKEILETDRVQKEAAVKKQAEAVLEAGNATAVKVQQESAKIANPDTPPAAIIRCAHTLNPLLREDAHKTIFCSEGGARILFNRPQCRSEPETLSALFQLYAPLCGHIAFTRTFLQNVTEARQLLCAVFNTVALAPCWRAGLAFLEAFCRCEDPHKLLVEKDSSVFQAVFSLLNNPASDGVREEVWSVLCVMTTEASARDFCAENFNEVVFPAVGPFLTLPLQNERESQLACAFLTHAAVSPRGRCVMCANSLLLARVTDLTKAMMTAERARGELVHSLMGFLTNLSLEQTALNHLQQAAPVPMLVQALTTPPDKTCERALALLARVLTSKDLLDAFMKERGLPKVLSMLRAPTAESAPTAAASVARILAKCAALSDVARADLAGSADTVRAIATAVKGATHGEAGNLALCLAYCLEAKGPEVAAALAQSDVVADLLHFLKSEDSSAAENCSIALARLAQNNPAHLSALRKQNGLEILQARMKK
eukprot:m.105603 g.105603  ORF g.105603 m.105603 type:complete len:696 (-) comp18946_c0_seq1:121-2208(-)